MFRTELSPKPSLHKIHAGNRLISIGSCFADNIGQQLADHKFKVIRNPFGIIFNPLSIFELLENAFNDNMFPESSYLIRDGIHFNYKVHSELNGNSQKQLTSKLNNQSNKLGKELHKSDAIIITLGTAWVYEEKKTQMLVANCHKTPAKQFNKRLLSTEEIVSGFMILKEQLQAKNPELKFILTVSPIRHIKDSFELNMVSKSVLRMASHQICTHAPDVDYFSAYEIMMDDLRDYRFYEKDMLHPNHVAKEYIWQKFMGVYFDESTSKFIKEWDDIIAAMNHKAFQPKSESHQKFLRNTLAKLEKLQHKVNVNKELQQVRKQLTTESK